MRAVAHGHASAPGARKNTGSAPSRIPTVRASRPSALRVRSPGVPDRCACGGSCPRCTAASSFAVSSAGDRSEREARGAARSVSAGIHASGQTRENGRGALMGTVPTGLPATAAQALRASGTPLELALRVKMERRFGADLSAVRIVEDSNAAASADALNANAYTLGEKIVFGRGKYAPHTADGQRLIAHEVAHVVRQDGSPTSARPILHREEPETEVDDIIVWNYINEAMEQNDGSIWDAWGDLMAQRDADPLDPNLAAAEHYFTAMFLSKYTPIPNFGVAYMGMGYGMIKDHLHDFGLGDLISFSDNPTTPSSTDQVEWGMRGAFEGGWTYDIYEYLFED